MPNSPVHLGEFTRALDDAFAATALAGRTLVALSISQPRIDRLGAALAALGWAATANDLVSIFVGLPIILLPSDAGATVAIDDSNQIYRLI